MAENTIEGDIEKIKDINSIISKVALRMDAGFRWSSLQVNVNTISAWHSDEVKGVMLLIVGGSFTGGAFSIKGAGSWDLCAKAILFRGSDPHRAEAFSGSRWSLVAYLHPGVAEVDQGRRSELGGLGFRCSPASSSGFVAPTRLLVSKDALSDPDFVYIGRGDLKLGLPPSRWGNPFRINRKNGQG